MPLSATEKSYPSSWDHFEQPRASSCPGERRRQLLHLVPDDICTPDKSYPAAGQKQSLARTSAAWEISPRTIEQLTNTAITADNDGAPQHQTSRPGNKSQRRTTLQLQTALGRSRVSEDPTRSGQMPDALDDPTRCADISSRAPSWTVPNRPGGLLGPIHPAGGPPPSQFAGLLPFVATTNVQPTQFSRHSPGISPKSIPYSELVSLKATHQEQVQALLEAHANELNSLRTHIALIERQATLPTGQRLSPSGLLPPLDTSPNIRRHCSDSENNNTSQSHVIRPSAASMSSFEAALESQKKATDEAVVALEAAQSQMRSRDQELEDLKRHFDVLKQSLALKDRSLAQMKNAITRAAERENTFKMKLADVEGRLEASNDQRVDLLESYHEARNKARVLLEKDSLLQKEFNNLQHGKTGAHNAVNPEVKATIIDLEDKLITIRAKLNVERSRVMTFESESRDAIASAETTKKELLETKTQREDIRSQLVERQIKLEEISEVLKRAQAEAEHAQKELVNSESKVVVLQTADAKKTTRIAELTTNIADLKAKIEELNDRTSQTPMESTGLITIANALGPLKYSSEDRTSVMGRLHLLSYEVRNLSFGERQRLVDEIQELNKQANNHQKDFTMGTVKERTSSRSIIRKLEAERDQLTALLTAEIRRSARASASMSKETFGLTKLERFDSVASRSNTLRHFKSSVSLASGECKSQHRACEEAYNQVRDSYEEEIRHLLHEIVLYQLDVKGYKKDLRKASLTIERLKNEGTPDDADDVNVPTSTVEWLNRVTRPEFSSARPRAATNTRDTPGDVERLEQLESHGRDVKPAFKIKLRRGVSWDSTNLRNGIPCGAVVEMPKVTTTLEDTYGSSRPLIKHRPSTKHLAILASIPPVAISIDGKVMKSSKSVDEIQTADTRKDSGVDISAGDRWEAERYLVIETGMTFEEETRPLSTVAEVGSAIGSAVDGMRSS